MLRRVVVTGIGAVSPLGCGNDIVWSNLLKLSCGISQIPEKLLVDKADCYVAGFVPRGDKIHEYNENRVFGRSVSREMSTFIQYAIYSSNIALKHSGDPFSFYTDKTRIGVSIGSGVGSIGDTADTSLLLQQSYKKVSPYFVPKILPNMAAGQVSIAHKLGGPCHSVATACAAGAHSIGDAYNFIRLGYADVMLAGGAEACIEPITIAGFSRLKALSNSKDPSKASRPFDKDRSGFILGEGSAILVLEDLENAQRRNAPILAEIIGYGLSGDGFHMTSPAPDGDGAQRAMMMALNSASLPKSAVSYINAHATSTPVGDNIEWKAIQAVFGADTSRKSPLYVSSTKGATGHLLGAAGALEAAFAVYSLHSDKIPCTLNLESVEADGTDNLAIQHVFSTKSEVVNVAMSNSFGFGGTNCSLLFKKYTK